MLIAFTGDPYLAREEAKAEARLKGIPERLIPAEPENLKALFQSGLFGDEEGILDMRELKSERWEEVKAVLDRLAPVRDILIYDPHSTSGRTRFYKNRGEVRSFPTPRFRERTIFVQNLLKKRGLKAPAAVVHLIAESEADTEGLVREVEKLALLPPPLTPERVRPLLAWPAATSAFDLLLPISRGEGKKALAKAKELLERGEPPLKVLGALSWHYSRLMELFFLKEELGELSPEEAAKRLGVAPYAARRLLEALKGKSEESLLKALSFLVEAEKSAKSGRDPEAALLGAVLRLSR